MIRNSVQGLTALLVLLAACSPASAAYLTATLTADDSFDLYLATDDTAWGSWLGNGADPATAYPFTSAVLAPGTDYFIHVAADNRADSAGILGEFSLVGTGFHFANGTTTLWTNTADWLVSSDSSHAFNDSRVAPVSLGLNGVAPWGALSGISPGADWIWTGNPICGTYFSARILPDGTPTPEPSALVALAGLAAVGLIAGRRRRRAAGRSSK